MNSTFDAFSLPTTSNAIGHPLREVVSVTSINRCSKLILAVRVRLQLARTE
jgi:hypothetical protein